MIVVETFLSCDGCGKNYGVDMRNRSGTQHRKSARSEGWRLVVGVGFNYGDYCPECLAENKHKKPKQ